MKNNNFKIVMTTFNAQKYIKKSIMSLINQRYKNWECIIIDDCSVDKTPRLIYKLVNTDKRFTFVKNTVKKYGLLNRIEGTNTICKNDEDIIVILDGDDWFYDEWVLEYLNHVYQDDNVWITYGQFKIATGSIGGCKDSYKPFYRLHHTDRNLSHLRSYKYWLFKKIKEEDFKNKNGDYFRTTEDVVLLYPMAEMAGNHLKFIPKVLYVYNNLNSLNEYKIYPGEQILVGNYLQRKQSYPILKDKNDTIQNKLSVKLYDKEFAHCKYSGTDVNGSDFIEWYRGEEKRDFTFYTDRELPKIETEQNNGSINVGWLLEPQAVNPESYNYILKNYNKFNYVLTHNKDILREIPNSAFIPSCQTWIARKNWDIHDKSKNVCFMVSNKKELEGHILRHEIIAKYKDKIDCVCGKGYKPFENKFDAMQPFRYCIVVQNCKRDYYFTEHLIDCFLTGTVPIFWGCPSIGKFFNTKGMYAFNKIEELKYIFNVIGIEDYTQKLPAIIDNFQKVHEYYLAEDYIYLNFIKQILTGGYPLC